MAICQHIIDIGKFMIENNIKILVTVFYPFHKRFSLHSVIYQMHPDEISKLFRRIGVEKSADELRHNEMVFDNITLFFKSGVIFRFAKILVSAFKYLSKKMMQVNYAPISM